MKIVMVGCGKMGGALLAQWVKGDDRFTVVDPGLTDAPDDVRLVPERAAIAGERFDAVVVAIKPQLIEEVLPDYADAIADDGYALSIAAGCSVGRIANALGGAPVVRVMPNLPAAIGKGVSGLFAGTATPAQSDHAARLMALAGDVVTVDDEDALDRVTAVAGSGPGYVFEIARTYVEAARSLGFDEEQARTLVLGTIAGAIDMARGSDETLETLRNSVTSKNGTTQAGLEALNADDVLTQRLAETVDAAYRRAVELR